MTVLYTIVVAFSMFSAIPMPQIEWSPKNMRYALCAFPLVGAVIALLMGAWTALCSWLLCWGLSFLLSRAMSGLAVASFPLAKGTGLAHSFASAADKKRVRAVLAVLSALLAAGMCAIRSIPGALMALTRGAVFLCYRRMARGKFGGLIGDLAGWFLQMAELFMLGALVLARLLEGKLCC